MPRGRLIINITTGGGNQDDAKDQYYHCQYFHTGRVRSLARPESPFKVALTVSYLFLLS